MLKFLNKHPHFKQIKNDQGLQTRIEAWRILCTSELCPFAIHTNSVCREIA